MDCGGSEGFDLLKAFVYINSSRQISIKEIFFFARAQRVSLSYMGYNIISVAFLSRYISNRLITIFRDSPKENNLYGE